MGDGDKKERNKFYHVAKRSLELIAQQIVEIENKIPITDLQKIRVLQKENQTYDEAKGILSKHLTEMELYDLGVWYTMKNPIRLFYRDFLSEAEKKNLENTISLVESLVNKKDIT